MRTYTCWVKWALSDIFSHAVGCLFVLLLVSFAMQKLLSLVRSHLFIFAIFLLLYEVDPKKILLQFMSKSILPVFSSRTFIVTGLTFKSLIHFEYIFVQFSSVTQSCPTLCDPMDCRTPGLPVHHQLPELIQSHVHWISDAIQPSHLLSSPSLPTFNLSQHQGLFKWVSSLHQVAKVLEFQLQYQSFQWIFRTDFL